MSEDPHAVKLYIDGNAYKNPGGNGGFACVVEYPESWSRENELVCEQGFDATSNNRMELLACVWAMNYAASRSDFRGLRVLIVTDSRYVYDNKNMPAVWRRNQWRTKAGRPIENVDLWKRYLTAWGNLITRIDIVWRKGKTSAVLKQVDKAAKAAGRAPLKRDRGFRPGKTGRARSKGGNAALFDAQGQEVAIRVYRTRLVNKTAHNVRFESLAEDNTVIGKFHAYCSEGLSIDLHRGHVYLVRFNDNREHPYITHIIEELDTSKKN